jgi:AraC-like DNA-binding protein
MYIVDQAPPDPRLQAFVRGYIQRRTPGKAPVVAVEPYVARLGGLLDFLFASLYDIPLQGTSDHARCFAAAVVGPHTHGRVQLLACGRIDEFAVMFRPQGLHQLFGEPTHLLVNKGLEAQAVLGSSIHRLYQQLGNAVEFRERIRLADAFLLKHLQYAKQPDRLSKAFNAVIAAARPLSVAEVARQAGLSIRQLERKCLECTGLSPKTLARVSRFERALALKRNSGALWTTIAHELQYSDQMHLIRDFRVLAGNTPAQIMSQIGSDHLISML